MGFQRTSVMMTRVAAVRVMPMPPAFVEMRKTGYTLATSDWKLWIISARTTVAVWPSRYSGFVMPMCSTSIRLIVCSIAMDLEKMSTLSFVPMHCSTMAWMTRSLTPLAAMACAATSTVLSTGSSSSPSSSTSFSSTSTAARLLLFGAALPPLPLLLTPPLLLPPLLLLLLDFARNPKLHIVVAPWKKEKRSFGAFAQNSRYVSLCSCMRLRKMAYSCSGGSSAISSVTLRRCTKGSSSRIRCCAALLASMRSLSMASARRLRSMGTSKRSRNARWSKLPGYTNSMSDQYSATWFCRGVPVSSTRRGVRNDFILSAS
eukprot:PhM_4_TR18031/c2_g1_i1/m.37161